MTKKKKGAGGETLDLLNGHFSGNVLVKEHDVAKMLGISVSATQKMRNAGTGPTWYRIGERMIRYRRDEILDWLKRQERKEERKLQKEEVLAEGLDVPIFTEIAQESGTETEAVCPIEDPVWEEPDEAGQEVADDV